MPSDPSVLSGKVLWLRAKDAGAAGASVATWTDQSGKGYNAVATGTAPLVAGASTPSGGSSIRFAGTGHLTPPNLGLRPPQPLTNATASSAQGGHEPFRAVDGATNSSWYSSADATTANPQWLQVQPIASTVATSYGILVNDNAAYQPKDWTFEGSMDGSSWTILDTRVNVTFTAGVTQTFTFANSTAFTYYRIKITRSGVTVVLIDELTINGIPNIGIQSDAEIWAVVKSDGGNNGGVWSMGADDLSQSHYPWASDAAIWDDFGTDLRRNVIPASGITYINSWRLVRIVQNAGAWTYYLDNTSQLALTGTNKIWPTSYNIGAGGPNTAGYTRFLGNIAEILLVNRPLSSGEAADLITYFNTEHGLSVAGGSSGTSTPQAFSGAGVAFSRSVGLGNFTAGNVHIPQAFTGSGATVTATAGMGSFNAPHSGGQSFTGQGVTFGHINGAGSFTAAGSLPSVVEKARYHGTLVATTTLTFSAPHQAGDIVVIAQLSRANNLPAATASGLGGTWTMQSGSSDPYGTNRVFISTNRTSAGTVTITGGASSAADVLWLGYVMRGASPTVSVLPSPISQNGDEHGRGQVVIVTALETAKGTVGSGLDMPATESLPSPSAWAPDSPYVTLSDGATGTTWAAGSAIAIPSDAGLYYADTNEFGNSAEFTQTRIAVGTYVHAQRFIGAGVADHVTAATGSFQALTSYGIGGTLTTGAITLPKIVVMAATTLKGGGSLTAGETMPVVQVGNVVLRGGGTLVTRSGYVATPDPRRLAPQWRYVVTDLANTPVGELVDIEHDAVEDGVGEATTMSFTIATDSDQCALIKPIERQCQVWEGDVLRLRGPILPGQPSDDGTTMTHKIHDPSWFWRDGRRVITRTPQKNLLHNGDFKNDLAWWTRGFDKDSIPAAAPSVRVVSEDFVDDTDGLDPIKAAEIVGVESVTEAELSSNAVFWPNLASFRPGGVASVEAVANAMPTTAGLKVTVVGHTANDGTGNGLGLSLRRAQAAAAVIKKKRPGVVITTRGVGFYDPNPKFPKNSQAQRRVVIQYEQTISGKSKQFMSQTVEVTQPKEARYPLVLTVAAMLKVADDWSVPDANMVSLKIVARRKGAAKPLLPWDDQLGQGSSSISDTDPVDRWIPQTAEATIPADGRPYLVDVYLYAPAALARYTAVGLFPDEQLYFWGQDQASIFKGVMEHIQKPEFGYADLGVATRAPLTGVKRDREFAFRDLTPADTALDGLMGISRGIEWDTITTPTVTTATSFYPRQGQSVDYMLVQGGNVATAVPANTRDVGSAIIAQAQGLGSYRAVAYANDTRVFGGTLIQRVITAEQDTPLNELRETAKAELFWARSSTPAYWVDIDPDSITDVLANTAKGDTVRLILDYPTAVDRLARIVRRQIHPDSLRLMVAFEEV